MSLDIQIKRVYEPANAEDGFRVLVDRLWPRRLKKEQVQAVLWLKEVAPSTELRNWYHHDLSLWEEFKHRYSVELDANPQAVRKLLDLAAKKRLTLLFASREVEFNQAVALKEYLLARSIP